MIAPAVCSVLSLIVAAGVTDVSARVRDWKAFVNVALKQKVVHESLKVIDRDSDSPKTEAEFRAAVPPPCTYRVVSEPVGGDAFTQNYFLKNQQSNQGKSLWWADCPGGGSGYRWIGDTPDVAPGGPPIPVVTPFELAVQARSELWVPVPEVGVSPQGNTPLLVNEDTGWWVTNAVKDSARAVAGPIWAEVTVTPVRTTWITSDGDYQQCAGVGVPWLGTDKPAGACTYTYRIPHDREQAQVRVEWAVSWRGSNGASGDLGTIVRQAVVERPVYERHAIGVSSS